MNPTVGHALVLRLSVTWSDSRTRTSNRTWMYRIQSRRLYEPWKRTPSAVSGTSTAWQAARAATWRAVIVATVHDSENRAQSTVQLWLPTW